MFGYPTPSTAGLIMMAGGIPPLLAVYWLRNYRHQPAVLWFQRAMVCGMVWSVSVGLIALVETPQLRFVAANVVVLTIPTASICYFIFSYEFTFKTPPPRAVFGLFVPPTLLFVAGWFNPGTLVYTTADPHLIDEILIPANEGSIQPLVTVGMGYTLVVMAAGMVFGELLRSTQPARKRQAAVILVSMVIVSALGAVKVLGVVPPYFDPTPIGWTLSGLLFAATITRHQFLQQSPAPWRQTVATIPEAVFVLDADSVVAEVNERATEILDISVGMTGEELQDRNPALSTVLDDTESATIELRAAGQTRVFDPHSSMLEYGRGATAMVISLQEVTDRAAAEETLQTTKERYRRIFQQSSDYVTIVDESETIIDVTQGVERILGYDPEEMIGRKAFSYVHPEDKQQAVEAFAEVVANPDRQLDIEFRVQGADGEYRWLEGRGTNHLEDPLIGGMLANVRDISERKEAERALEETKERYSRMFELSTDYVTIVDESGTIIDITPGIEDVLTYEPEEMIGTDALDYIHPDDRAHVHEVFADALGNSAIGIDIEYRAETSDGNYRWMEARGHNHLDDPLLEGVVVNVRDISERKQREQELTRLTRQLRQKNQQLERLAGVVSHDLQTPLSTAEKLTGLLRADLGEADPAVEQSLADLEATHQRLQEFADQLPRLARESTDVEEPTTCDLQSVAESAWSFVETGSLDLQIASTSTVRADPSRLQRVFENLFQNTVTHGVEAVDGEQAHTATTVRVGSTDDGFYIEDDGPGIRPEQRSELFEYGMSTGSGSGFGLAIVRTIIEAHGWTVDVVDSDTGGARFEVETTE
ncbi:MAG: PAS domain S-box protein [Euryarchaeota archaeon]|nr:PAS domain S-box protein [Euryarchaeota archaeon]